LPERDIISNTCLPFEDEVPSPNTYAFPLLSVRIDAQHTYAVPKEPVPSPPDR